MARCSFDNHIQEIIGSVMIGATLIMLRPRGTVELNYLAGIMRNKQVSYMHSVPSLIRDFFTFLIQTNSLYSVKSLRSLCTIGKYLSNKLYILLRRFLIL
jgi:non-ribosomal peptide synthetase component F